MMPLFWGLAAAIVAWSAYCLVRHFRRRGCCGDCARCGGRCGCGKKKG